MRPPTPKTQKLTLNSSILAVVQSPIIIVDHYPTAQGRWDSEVRTLDNFGRDYATVCAENSIKITKPGHCSAINSYQTPMLAWVEFPAQVATKAPQIVQLGTQQLGAQQLGAQQLGAQQLGAQQLGAQWANSGDHNMLTIAPTVNPNYDPTWAARYINQQQLARQSALPTQQVEPAMLQSTLPSNAPRQPETLKVSEKACDVDIEVGRMIKARVNVSYNIDYDGNESPRADEKVVNVSLRNTEKLGNNIAGDLARIVGTHVPAVQEAAPVTTAA